MHQGAQFVPTKRSLQQQDRAPLATLEETLSRIAIQRLVQNWTAETYQAVVEMVADIYWLQDQEVRAKVLKTAKKLGV